MTTWLTLQEAADRIRTGREMIRQAVNRGDLPAYAVGNGRREYRLKADEVDEWMSSRPWEPSK